MTDLQGKFAISGNTGFPAALNAPSTAPSNWSLCTNAPTTQQHVIQSAQGPASTFQETAANVSGVATSK